MVGLGYKVYQKIQTAWKYQILEKINTEVLKEIFKNLNKYKDISYS